MIDRDYANDDVLLSRDAESLPEDRRANSSWLIPLLFLPVAFFVGVVAADYFNNPNTNSAVDSTQFGVGGAPGVFPTPTPEVSATPVISPLGDPDSSVDDGMAE